MKLNVALQIIMATMFNSSFTHGSDHANTDRKLSSLDLEKVVGNGCRNKIDFNARFIATDGQACSSCKLCAGGHLNHLFIPAVKDICIECSEEDSSCIAFEVITSFAQAWKMVHTTLKAGVDSSSDPTKVVILGSNNLVDWVALHDETIKFENRDQTAEFVIKNDEVFQHYSAQFHRAQDTMHVGQYGLIEEYTKSCTSQLHAGITGQLIPYYTTSSPTTAPSNTPTSQPTNPLGHQFNTNNELKKAVMLWFSNSEAAIDQYGEVADWEVGKITNMDSLFDQKLHRMTVDVSRWDVSKVTTMHRAFTNNGRIFNTDLSQWNVSSVKDMTQMFGFSTGFNQNLSDWNISSVTSMSYMFYQTSSFDQTLCWDLSEIATSRMKDGSKAKIDPKC